MRREISIVLESRQRPEPDVVVVHADADAEVGKKAMSYPAEAVLVAIEVVSPESATRDRKRKPLLYAEAGITYLWIVEESDERPLVHAYELHPATGVYDLLGVFRDRLTLAVPFPIDIDLNEIDNL